ncbi:uncharacterized protein EI90DRAFT_3047364 [Cantharellus anzutake]|uniref:uncharacterized protein n=1 Tax=Cantharellus anzutake TaxID=1750568 RepID=UPI001909030D|nr:uncharacterized protein EI90DRAFT_3047364 [Cantharellus anzutake]KAF8335869.1 hypothetical protein EI90DRAFT_3047364 [Cantharellus anzutake]
MPTARIMHECIKKLLSNVDDPEEEEIESLCQLLTTVGHHPPHDLPTNRRSTPYQEAVVPYTHRRGGNIIPMPRGCIWFDR